MNTKAIEISIFEQKLEKDAEKLAKKYDKPNRKYVQKAVRILNKNIIKKLNIEPDTTEIEISIIDRNREINKDKKIKKIVEYFNNISDTDIEYSFEDVQEEISSLIPPLRLKISLNVGEAIKNSVKKVKNIL